LLFHHRNWLKAAPWSADIETALVNIRAKIQSGDIVALQALVGAPTHVVGNKCFTPLG